ncbi:peptidylprolyl isomerase, partial [Acinetobacter baumannii]
MYAAAPEDQAARDVARSEACAAIEELRRNSDDFPILARQRSACPSAAMGGNLGQIGPGQTVPEFEQALAAMAVGSICPEPVETRYGF